MSEQGTLFIADIGGYTKYLTGVELDHSHDILADLISTVAEQTKGAFQLAKLEGDAIFCYAPDGCFDGSHLVTTVDSCYFAFKQRLRDIKAATTCPCGACRLIPQLNLKFVAHHGSYVIHEVMGMRELVGSDVIAVHRLLKNDVVENAGITNYALFTRSIFDSTGLKPEALEMVPTTQEYDDVGAIEAYSMDMESRWIEEQNRSTNYISEPDAWVTITLTVAAPPPEAWDIITSPKRLEWMKGVSGFEQENPDGVRGVGTTNHCMHGKSVVLEKILDWRPYRYFTVDSQQGKTGRMIFTWELTPNDDETTKLDVRVVVDEPGLKGRFLKLIAPMLRKKLAEMEPAIAEYIETTRAESGSEAQPQLA
ncbi:MAG TPA: DUF2652 domain-containing protein [Actinomycetota bacterium]|nr:DUF2652 domain-containing protein [Actinomycetota bacterium]